MPEIGIEENKSAFIGPAETEWRSLSAVPDSEEDEMRSVRTNRDELHNALLASLQMQHLVVLAGSASILQVANTNRAIGEFVLIEGQ